MGGGGKGGGVGPPEGWAAPEGFDYTAPRAGEDVINQADYGSFGQFADALHMWRYDDFLAGDEPDYMSMLGGMMEGQAADAAKRAEDYMQQQKDALAQQRREGGIRERDSLYSDYMNAAGSATDFINSSINQERSNARLMGTEYKITDEQKQGRINDYFATIWGEGDQQRLEGLMGEWGNPTGFDQFAVTRGEGGTAPAEGKESGAGVSGGLKPKSSLATLRGKNPKEDELGGTLATLGG